MDLSVIVLALLAFVHSAAAAVTLMEQILTGCCASLREAWSASRSGRKVVVTQTRSVLWTALLLVLAGSARAQSSADLGGTSWQLVKFRSSDGSTLSPMIERNIPSPLGSMAVLV